MKKTTQKIKFLLLFLFVSTISLSQTQIGIDIDGEAAVDLSSRNLTLSGDGQTVAIGAISNDGGGSNSGHVRIFRNVAGTWTQLGADINGEAAGDECGIAVSLSNNGNIVAVGAFRNDSNGANAGHVRVFQYNGTSWIQLGAELMGAAADDHFGSSVSLTADGSILAVGSFLSDANGTNSGKINIYKNVSSVWTPMFIGNSDGLFTLDQYGVSLDISANGEYLIVGANASDANGTNSGQVRILRNVADNWFDFATINGEAAQDQLGYSVSISNNGTRVAIGAYLNDGNGTDSGHVRVYQYDAGTFLWTQLGADINGATGAEHFGFSTSISGDGNTLVVGAPQNGSTGTLTGQARVFKLINNVWTQVGLSINGEAIQNFCGYSIATNSDGTVAAIGAQGNSGNGSSSGHTRVYDISSLLNKTAFEIENVNIYPNPVNDVLTIDLNSEISEIKIINFLGQVVKSIKNTTKINVSDLENGAYLLETRSNDTLYTSKIIKSN